MMHVAQMQFHVHLEKVDVMVTIVVRVICYVGMRIVMLPWDSQHVRYFFLMWLSIMEVFEIFILQIM